MKQQYESINQETLVKFKLAKEISYKLKLWDRLIGYLDTPVATTNNYLAENSIRLFYVGWLNWLFSGHPKRPRLVLWFIP